MTNQLPDPWKHESGDRLNADGEAITYRHPETEAEITVEASVNEEDDEMEYIVFAFNDDRDSLKHPAIRRSKEAAWVVAQEWAEEHIAPNE